MTSTRDLILQLMHHKTERDKQVTVGASNFSQPCPRCLAEALVAETADTTQSPYWFGAWEGTAVHERMEALIKKHRPTWFSERKVVLGTLPGYGKIKSTMDVYIPETRTVGDFKTTTRAKLGSLKEAFLTEPTEYDTSKVDEARYKAVSYGYQGQLYGWGLEQEGYPVETIALIFICRDGTGDRDIWVHEMPYQREVAERAWDRLERLWAWLQAGGDPATLKSHPQCYHCRVNREE